MRLIQIFYYVPKIISTIKLLLNALFSSDFLALGIVPGTNIQLSFDSYIISIGITALLFIEIKTKIIRRLIYIINLSRKQKAIDLISI